jgi:hypothetical protein
MFKETDSNLTDDFIKLFKSKKKTEGLKKMRKA